MIKKVIIVIIIFQIFFIPIVNAANMDSTMNDADNFFQEGKTEGSDLIDQSKLQIEINYVYNILFAIGVGLSVLVGAMLGIRYMLGSVEEQAKIKETFIPYAIGCIVVFGAFGIWKIIITIGGNIF